MRPKDRDLAQSLGLGLRSFHERIHALPGICNVATRLSFLEQLLESIHRVNYVSVILTRDISSRRLDPNDELFDPLKASILFQRHCQTDEAFWMVFLFVHFGMHHRGGWRYVRQVYGRLGSSIFWNWANTSADPRGFREWLNDCQNQIRSDPTPGGFGNHRKYQSLDAYNDGGTGAAFESYVNWVAPPRTHAELIEQAMDRSNGDSKRAFDYLYRSMAVVDSFGRTAKFDYLTMIGKLGLAPIEAGSTYMPGATGPIHGARLLFGINESARNLENWLVELDSHLNVGMQVLEDALCNWHKSPGVFKPFRG